MTYCPMKEDDGDRAVKASLWEASEREILRFAGRYRQEHCAGVAACRAQDDVADAAKQKGYPKGLIRFLGAQKRGDEMDAAGLQRLREYRQSIGL